VALDAFRHDEVTSSRIHGLHRRWRINELTATAGGGFVIAGGGSQLALDSTGCPQTQYSPDVVSVDDEFEVRWRWPAPPQVSIAAIAADAEGGVVATFLTHGATSLGQLEIGEQSVGVLHLDGTGRLTWARLLALGYQRLPHYVAVEPGGQGRIAVAMADSVVLDPQQGGEAERGLRFRVLSSSGSGDQELLRPWSHVSGAVWTSCGRLLVVGDRDGVLDPQTIAFVEPLVQRAEGGEEPPGAIGVAELIDVHTGQAVWRREWERSSPGWEARPTLGANGAVAFIDLLASDYERPARAGSSNHRLIVLDAADGTVRWTRLMERDCGYRHVVAADPRDGDLLVGRTQRCTGRDFAGTSVVVERLSPDGQLRWSEALGEPLGEGRASAFHLGAAAVSESGRAAFVGFAAFMEIAGVSVTTDFEHYALVFEP
jgi:hypothetical protein